MKLITSIIALFFCFSFVNAQTYEDWVEKSFTFMENKEWSAAEECLLKALRLKPANPENAILLSNLGTVQREQGKIADALQSYNTGLLFAEESPTLLLNRATLYLDIDSTNLALADLSAAIAIDHKNIDPYYVRGMIYLERADTTGALNDFQEMLKINPNSSKARLGLAAVNTEMGAYSEAERLYNIVITNNPKNPNIYLNRAELYFLWDKNNKALEDIRKALNLDPENPIGYVLRGKIKMKQYEPKSAHADFLKAKELGFDSPMLEEYLKQSKK
ncbi:MAG: tetratricopeptide repeat protein [Bacteroidales bacterium]